MRAARRSAARRAVASATTAAIVAGAALTGAPGAAAAAPAAAGPAAAPAEVAPAAAATQVLSADRPAALAGAAPLRPAAVEDGPDQVLPGANVARVLFTTRATERPGGGKLLARVGALAPFGSGEAQYAVDAQRVVDGRLYVRMLLAQRPNGTAGWVSGDDVALLRTRWRVAIDLRARQLTVAFGDRRVKRFPAVVGRPSAPTPRGRFAISELLPQRPANGFFGSWIVPITAFSDTYTEFLGGPGRVAIHGRGAASLLDPLGSATSHGCVRLRNGDIAWLARRLEPGVPVTVR
ncbi:L,D-transpeptidase [Conexibacter woesei]|uniref:ErfK/YbiS/YcfS/YnhG family protein n=1 Tax=Conexibacter woesei (strain DSM 14684 / CCUG 47730 / CIP 108061 / JCM 11494 / NBRC 100937 / ID131577) TaxID=469383 RepID=D3F9P5_CONWI|nr:L,D-transpeptidase [Conexibacter woesei]ADB51107.1 ErfK/YbiS/YcfS/YnhG family protein [Conexibacter woesei DSM 14684]